jgi:hypothetical protein
MISTHPKFDHQALLDSLSHSIIEHSHIHQPIEKRRIIRSLPIDYTQHLKFEIEYYEQLVPAGPVSVPHNKLWYVQYTISDIMPTPITENSTISVCKIHYSTVIDHLPEHNELLDLTPYTTILTDDTNKLQIKSIWNNIKQLSVLTEKEREVFFSKTKEGNYVNKKEIKQLEDTLY